MAQEKRKDMRVKEDFSVLCKIFRKTELDISLSRIIDISKSGISFFTDNPLAPGDILQLILRIPPDYKEKVELFGRVIESLSAQPAGFKTRVMFLTIDAHAEATLKRLVEHSGRK